jgi:MoaA/NifB/PqqE/SkfB family radical SAM enzyme
MYLYETIIKELENYPAKYFSKQFQIAFLTFTITQRCNNRCVHCQNYASPLARTYLPLKLIQKLIDEAVDLKYKRTSIWGGEPFLHKDIYAIMEYIFLRGLNLQIITNGYWAKSEKIVWDFLKRFAPLIGNKKLSLEISCDKFHQAEDPATLQNVANLVAVFETQDEIKHLEYRLLDAQEPGDDQRALENLLALLKQSHPELPAEKIRQNYRPGPVAYGVGRAKLLPRRYANPLSEIVPDIAKHLPQVPLMITPSGNTVLHEFFVGDELLPCGNVRDFSLSEIVANMNNNRLLKLFRFLPLKFFFFPFRKYVDIRAFTQDLAAGLITNYFYSIEYVLEMLQLRKKQFDKSAELKAARAVYMEKMNQAQALACLQTIADYGDLSDIDHLEHLGKCSPDSSVRERAQKLLDTLFSGAGTPSLNLTKDAGSPIGLGLEVAENAEN